MTRSNNCKEWLCHKCTDDYCDHYCHQQNSPDKKVVEV